MKGPFTKRLLLSVGLGALLSSCQPVQYTAQDEGFSALQTLKKDSLPTPVPSLSPPSLSHHGPFAPPFSLTSAVAISSSTHGNPYASLTAKDYALKQPERTKQSFPLETFFSLPHIPLYSTAHPLVSFEPYLLAERRERRLDRACFPSREEERFALEEGWFVYDLKPRDNRDREEERSLPLGKLGHALRKVLEKSNNSFGQVLRGFSGIADGPTQSLLGNHWKTKFNLRAGTKKAGIYLTLKESNALKFTLGYETSANIGGKEGDAAFFLTFEHPLKPSKNSQ